MNRLQPPDNYPSPLSTSESAGSKVSVGYDQDWEFGFEDHSYNKPLPASTSRNEVAQSKLKNCDCVSSGHELISDSLVGEEANAAPKVIPSNTKNIADKGDANEPNVIQTSNSSIQSNDELSEDNVRKTDSTNKMSTIISENTNNIQSSECLNYIEFS